MPANRVRIDAKQTFPLFFSRHRFGDTLADYQLGTPVFHPEKNELHLDFGLPETHQRMGKTAAAP